MLVATYNDVYAKKIASKLPSPSRLLSNLVPVSHIFHLEGHFGFSPPLLLFNAECSELFFLELFVSVSNYNNCCLAPFRSSLQCAFETS